MLKAWANKYGKRTVCMKYYRACNTNAEEALNAIMIMLFDKRLFSRDAARYDCCAYACALFLNERGWGFKQRLHEVIGHKLSTFSLYAPPDGRPCEPTCLTARAARHYIARKT